MKRWWQSQLVHNKGGGGGGGGAPSSAARPSTRSGANAAGTDTIFPANWGGATGDAFLMFFTAESFTTFGTATVSPTEGTATIFQNDDGTTQTVIGAWFIDSYSGSGNPTLNFDPGGGGSLNTIFQQIHYWDVLVAAIPTQCIIQNGAVQSPSTAGTTFAGSDEDNWEVTASFNRLNPPPMNVDSGANWLQYRYFAVGDDGTMNDTNAFYDEFYTFSSTGGSDLCHTMAVKVSDTPLAGGAAEQVNQPDIGAGVYAAGGFNCLLGT